MQRTAGLRAGFVAFCATSDAVNLLGFVFLPSRMT